MNRRLSALLPVGAALAVVACGDDPAGPGGGSEFDPVAVQQALGGVYAGLDEESDLLVGIDLASEALGGSAGGAALVAGRDLTRPRFAPGAAAARVLLAAAPADAVAPVFPSNVLGKTFVWNPDTGSYEVDDALTGAPANGVRFVLYAIEPVTRRPVEPLVEVGYLDLVDESGAESVRIVVRAVVGGETLVDYFVDGSQTLAGSTLTVTAAGVGYVSDGTHRLDFDLAQSAAFTQGSPTATFTVDHYLTLEGAGVSVGLTGSIVLDLETGSLVSAEVALGIEHGADDVVFTVAAGTESLDGSIRHNGDVVVLIGGMPDNPEFTDAEGGQLTPAELEALRDLLELVDVLFEFAENLFHPFEEAA